jgi:hypothetical protein
MCEDATREAQEVSETTGIVALEPAAATSSSWKSGMTTTSGRARAGGGARGGAGSRGGWEAARGSETALGVMATTYNLEQNE